MGGLDEIFRLKITTHFRILCVANRKGEVFKLVFNSAHRNIDTPICNVDLSPPKEPGKPENAKTNAGYEKFQALPKYSVLRFQQILEE